MPNSRSQKSGGCEPGGVEQRQHMVEQLTWPGADLVFHRLPSAVRHGGVHLVRRQDAGQPFDGEEPVLSVDGDVVPGVVAVLVPLRRPPSPSTASLISCSVRPSWSEKSMCSVK